MAEKKKTIEEVLLDIQETMNKFAEYKGNKRMTSRMPVQNVAKIPEETAIAEAMAMQPQELGWGNLAMIEKANKQQQHVASLQEAYAKAAQLEEYLRQKKGSSIPKTTTLEETLLRPPVEDDPDPLMATLKVGAPPKGVGYGELIGDEYIQTGTTPYPVEDYESRILYNGYGMNENEEYVNPTHGPIHNYNPGLDISGELGDKVASVNSGTVLEVRRIRGYGKTIMVEHADGTTAVYSGLDDINVKVGQTVKPGMVIGTMGDGYIIPGSTGDIPVLHFEIRKWDGRRNPDINPIDYLQSLTMENKGGAF